MDAGTADGEDTFRILGNRSGRSYSRRSTFLRGGLWHWKTMSLRMIEEIYRYNVLISKGIAKQRAMKVRRTSRALTLKVGRTFLGRRMIHYKLAIFLRG